MSRIGNNMLTRQIWQHIAELGAMRGLDADALAEAAHITPARIQAFAEGTTVMRIDDLTGFSQALGIPIAELLDEDGLDTAKD